VFLILLICFAYVLSGCTDNGDLINTETYEVPIENTPAVSLAVEETPKEVPDDELVKVLDYIPDIFIELRYSTEDNFTGKIIYDFTDAYLRYGTVKKLAVVQERLAESGFYLKIWDAYRPVSAQFALWEACPDPAYVADPNTGYSNHNRGNTVDVTLVTCDGEEIEMPTGFDDFSLFADRDYTDISQAAMNNVMILENAMEQNGFTCYFKEWWHYSDNVAYDVVTE